MLSFPHLVVAGQLYRFTDENGVITLSRSMPPTAAQRGYDIIDDRTMRLIKRVDPAPTAEQIESMKQEKKRQAELQRQAEQARNAAERARQKQAAYDRSLLITYPSETDLLRAKESDMSYRQQQINQHQSKMPELQKQLDSIQQQAAERELSGAKVTKNMQKRLDAAQEEIRVRKETIKQLQTEIDDLSAKYDRDLQRLRLLLEAKATR